jgi:hypothetical protein
MGEVSGKDEEVLERVQAIFDGVVPGALCELQDYNFRIGCGAMDQWDSIKEVVFLRRGLTEEMVEHQAQVLSRKVASGGSTAGEGLQTDR